MHEDSFSWMQDRKETNSIPLGPLCLWFLVYSFFIKPTKEWDYLASGLLFDGY